MGMMEAKKIDNKCIEGHFKCSGGINNEEKMSTCIKDDMEMLQKFKDGEMS